MVDILLNNAPSYPSSVPCPLTETLKGFDSRIGQKKKLENKIKYK